MRVGDVLRTSTGAGTPMVISRRQSRDWSDTRSIGGKSMRISSKSWLALPFAAALLSLGAQAPAQAAQSGLVNVDLSHNNVLNDIANNLHLNVSQIPVTVQAPIGVAANVC